MASQSKTPPTIEINGLIFTQHRESITAIFNASKNGNPEPMPLYAYFGGIKLDSLSIEARINNLIFNGYIQKTA